MHGSSALLFLCCYCAKSLRSVPDFGALIKLRLPESFTPERWSDLKIGALRSHLEIRWTSPQHLLDRYVDGSQSL